MRELLLRSLRLRSEKRLMAALENVARSKIDEKIFQFESFKSILISAATLTIRLQKVYLEFSWQQYFLS